MKIPTTKTHRYTARDRKNEKTKSIARRDDEKKRKKTQIAEPERIDKQNTDKEKARTQIETRAGGDRNRERERERKKK